MTRSNNFESVTKMLSAARVVVIGVAVLGACTLKANTVFSDGTFNLSNYSISTFQTGGATINVSQTLTGGDPGAALDISTSVPAGVGESLNSRSYIVNTTFLYNPSTSGAVSAVGVSADVYRLFTGDIPSLVGFSPVIYQNGNYYAYYTISTSYAPGVYQNPSATLLPNQFDLITDPSSGAVDSSTHPNLDGDPFELGFSASLVSSGVSQAFTGDFKYDNLSFDVISNAPTTVPEPSATTLISLGLVAIGIGIRKKMERKQAAM
jgi:hypothetical protein